MWDDHEQKKDIISTLEKMQYLCNVLGCFRFYLQKKTCLINFRLTPFLNILESSLKGPP